MDALRREKGLYWDAAWKLVEGCTKVSPGCDNCWSETETVMRARHPNETISSRARAVLDGGFTCRRTGAKPGSFFGNILCREDNLDLPLRTRKPTVFAVWNDLFHEDVSDHFRDRAYAVMALCPQHTFLVLTKRAKGMAAYWNFIAPNLDHRHGIIDRLAQQMDKSRWRGLGPFCGDGRFPHIWHGVTTENQQAADERIPHLLQVPGKRFLSVEPMLGPLDLRLGCEKCGHLTDAECPGSNYQCNMRPPIHFILCGGESGKNARPMHPDWVRSLRDQCAAAGVPFFFKQWGEWEPVGPLFSGDRTEAEEDRWADEKGLRVGMSFEGQIFNQYELPKPKVFLIERVGKRAAGRILDGRTHDDLPWG